MPSNSRAMGIALVAGAVVSVAVVVLLINSGGDKKNDKPKRTTDDEKPKESSTTATTSTVSSDNENKATSRSLDFSNVPVAAFTKEASEKQEIESVPEIQENLDVANRHAKLAEKDSGKILDAKAAGAPVDTSLDAKADKNESTSAEVSLTTKPVSVKEVAQPADPLAENVAEHVVAQLVKQTEESATPVVQVAKDTKATLPESTTPKTVPTTPEKVDVSTAEETFGSALDPSDLRESTSTVLVDKPKDNQPTTTTKDGESPNDIGSDKNWVTVETKNNEDSEEMVPAAASTEELPAETTAATLSPSSPKATTATSPIKKKGPGAPKAGARRSNKKKKGKKKK